MSSIRSCRLFALPALCATLLSCAASGPFPSLAPRPVEKELAAESTPSPAPPAAPDPAVIERARQLVAAARESEAAFREALAAAEPAVAKGGAAESENWVEAQRALSRAEAARSPIVNALAELDALGIANAGQASNQEVIAASLAEVQALADLQKQQLDRLQAQLSQP